MLTFLVNVLAKIVYRLCVPVNPETGNREGATGEYAGSYNEFPGPAAVAATKNLGLHLESSGLETLGGSTATCVAMSLGGGGVNFKYVNL